MPAKAQNEAVDGYATLDFGDGRKLERFGDLVLDRPSPAAEGIGRADPDLWSQADLRFDKDRGETGTWSGKANRREIETAAKLAGLEFRIRPNASGNVGLFPESVTVWNELRSVIASVVGGGETPRVLNLFAYTGGASLAAAKAGAEVVHVDSSATSVNLARENAARSGLADAPIRWIVEDARKFVAREVRRGNRYDAAVLDPPTWGHGPKGQPWRFEEDLPELLEQVGELTRPAGGVTILTGHAPGWDANAAVALVRKTLQPVDVAGRPLFLTRWDGRRLDAGWMAVGRFAGTRRAFEGPATDGEGRDGDDASNAFGRKGTR